MRNTLVLSLALLLGACVTKVVQAPAPPPQEQPQQTPPTEPAAYEEQAPTELPGTYVEGLGNPVITVLNHLEEPLSLSITDSSGYSYDYFIEAGQSQDVTLNAGDFSFQAYSGANSLNGTHSAEYDNQYEWEFSLE